MKDADLHTAAGQTVEPLPFRAATHYPYGAELRYPDDPAHRRYVAEYNTRPPVPNERATPRRADDSAAGWLPSR